jgi:hypothetical protein
MHKSKESNYDKAEDLQEEYKFEISDEAMDTFKYALYEVELEMELDTETGVTNILKVDGRELIDKTKGE